MRWISDQWRDPLYRNSHFVMLATWTQAVLGGLFWLVAARRFPTEEVGASAAMLSTVALVVLLSLGGLGPALVRHWPDGRVAASLVALVLGATALLALGWASGVLVFLLLGPGLPLGGAQAAGTFGAAAVAAALLVQSEFVFSRQRAAGWILALSVAVGLGRLAGLTVPGLGVLGAWAWPTVGVLALVALGLWRVVPGFPCAPGPGLGLVRGLVPYSGVQYLSHLAYGAAVFSMPVIVFVLLGAGPAAWFYVAFAVATALFAIPNAASRALFVELSSRAESPARKAALLTILAALLALVLGVFTAAHILAFFGAPYAANASAPLQILAASLPFVAARALADARASAERRLGDVALLGLIPGLLYPAVAVLLLQSTAASLSGVAWAWFVAHAAAAAYAWLRGLLRRTAPRHAQV